MKAKTVGQGCTALFLLSAATLSMGAKSCAKTPDATRTLKLDVDVAAVNAMTIRGPSGEIINFPYLANALFYTRVMNSNNFVISNPIPSPATATDVNHAMSKPLSAKIAEGTAVAGDGDVSSNDINVLARYGFLHSVPVGGGSKSSTLSGGVSGKAVVSQSVSLAADPQACVYNGPQQQLTGDVLSFELTDSFGIGIGWSGSGALDSTKIGVNFQFSQAKLDISLRANGMLSHQVTAQAEGIATNDKFSVGLGIPVSGIPIDLSYMSQTPITDTIKKSFDKGLTTIVDSFKQQLSPQNKQWNEVWEARVISDPVIADNDTHVAFRSGLRAGVQKGDQFTITNMTYRWKGAPCASDLDYSIGTTTAPIAMATVIEVGDNVSVATVQFLQDVNIKPGAQVKIYQLVNPTPAASPTPAPTPASQLAQTNP